MIAALLHILAVARAESPAEIAVAGRAAPIEERENEDSYNQHDEQRAEYRFWNSSDTAALSAPQEGRSDNEQYHRHSENQLSVSARPELILEVLLLLLGIRCLHHHPSC
jgi:hypothetical protein